MLPGANVSPVQVATGKVSWLLVTEAVTVVEKFVVGLICCRKQGDAEPPQVIGGEHEPLRGQDTPPTVVAAATPAI